MLFASIVSTCDAVHSEILRRQQQILKWLDDYLTGWRVWANFRCEATLLRRLLENATSYEEWKQLATRVDHLEGKDAWKKKVETPLYDYQLLRKRRDYLRRCRQRGDVEACALSLRSGLLRNIGGSSNPILYQQTFVGTKELIEEYQNEVVRCLEFLCRTPDALFPLPQKLAFFTETRHAYGRTALLLSGGASLGMYHLGVVKTLLDQRLLPRVIAGSSAGSLVAAFLGTRRDEELPLVFEPGRIQYGPFEERGQRGSLMRKLRRLLQHGVLMDVKVLETFVRENLGDMTFQEAYDYTGRVLNITVTGHGEHCNSRLLNYLTAPNVLVWSAAVASCAVPLLYAPVELYAKNHRGHIVPYHPPEDGQRFVDGSISADLPMARLSELFNVNQFIVSQTNPWVIPFLPPPADGGGALGSSVLSRDGPLAYLLFSEFKHRCTQLADIGVIPRSVARYLPLITQEYRGHVTIWPAASLRDYQNIISNPSEDDIQRCLRNGARRSWPKVSLIKSLCQIEQTLEQCVREVRRQLHLDRQLWRVGDGCDLLTDAAALPDAAAALASAAASAVAGPLPPLAEDDSPRFRRDSTDSESPQKAAAAAAECAQAQGQGHEHGPAAAGHALRVPRNISFTLPRTPSGSLDLMIAVAAEIKD